MQNHLILTVDYELFGNGSGDIVNCVIKPTAMMLDIADRYNAKLTLFVDIAEFHTMNENEIFHNDIKLVYAQIQDAVRRGHDIQLHIHPQWIGAVYNDGSWDLALDKWRIADVDSETLKNYFIFYKNTLEKIVHVVKPGYKCQVFRAGGWCIQPSDKVLNAMRAADLYIDSTVAPGTRLKYTEHWFDFSEAPKKPFWRVYKDVCIEAKEGHFLEIPIATIKSSYVKQCYRLLKSKYSSNSNMACNCYGTYEDGNSLFKKIQTLSSKLINLNNVMFDFSTITSEMMMRITMKHSLENANYPIKPIVAISHNKNFSKTSAIEFETYLAAVSQKEEIVFSTYNRFLSIYEK